MLSPRKRTTPSRRGAALLLAAFCWTVTSIAAAPRADAQQVAELPVPTEGYTVVVPGCAAAAPVTCSVPWEVLAQGEYIGPARTADVPVYWLRAGDELEFVYRRDREATSQPYELQVGDRVRVESVNDASLDLDVMVQPDGMITLRMLGQVRAAHRTIEELRSDLEQQYAQYYKVPAISVTPIQVNTPLEDLWSAIESPGGTGGAHVQQARVAPDGTVQLPAVGAVPAQGLSLDELKLEIDERYAQIAEGISVTPRLVKRAPRHVYVLGEVRRPGRYTLQAPTTVMQAIALAGGWNERGKLSQIVVFRRTEDWSLMATQLDLRPALSGQCACPGNEIWLRDSDIVLVPKKHWAAK